MPNNDMNINNIHESQIAVANVGGNLTGDIIAGDKHVVQYITEQKIIRQAAKQIITAPYKFLASYDISDRDIFFGRDAVIEELVGKMPRYKTLVINGRSGSGKTSLINAGLIPRLTDNGYQYLSFRDYTDPLRQLREHVAQDGLFNAYAEQTASLVQFLKTVTRRQPPQHVVLVFDQFERFFVNVPATVRTQFIQEIKACLYSDLSGEELDFVFALREEFFGQFTREFGVIIPAFLKETDLFSLSPLCRAEARDAILKPLEQIPHKIGYDPDFVDEVLLPGLMGESSGGMAIDPPHLQIVCNQLYEKAKERYAAKLEQGGVVEIDRALYDDLQGTTGILHSYLDDRLTKIVPRLSGDETVLRSMLKTMVETAGTRKFVSFNEIQRGVADVSPAVVIDGLRALREERIIEMRGQDETTSYSLSHEVMVTKVQSWFDERELQRKKAQETLERGLKEWESNQAILNEKQVEHIRQWARTDDLTAQAEALLTTSQRAYEEQQRKEAEQERRIRLGKRILWGVIATAFVVAGVLTFWALRSAYEKNQANQGLQRQTEIAEAKRREAETERTRAQTIEKERTRSLFESYVTHASLLTKVDDYARAQKLLNTSRMLDTDILVERRNVRNVLAWFTELMGGTAVQTYIGAKVALRDLAMSPDGRVLAAVGEQGMIVLFDPITGTLLKRWQGHANTATAIVFHPAGQWFSTSGDNDRNIIGWSLPEGEKLWEWNAPDAVMALAINPDGSRLASGGKDQQVTLWDTTTGTVVQTLQGHTGTIQGLAFSPDGQLLVSAAADHSARIWDLSTQQLRHELRGHNAPLNDIIVHPDGQRVATSSNDKTIRLWDVNTGRTIQELVGHKNEVNGLAWVEAGQYIASGSRDRTVRIWHLASGVTMRVLQGHEHEVDNLTAAGTRIYSASGDYTLKSWDVRPQERSKHVQLVDVAAQPSSVALAPNGNRAAVGLVDGTLRVYTFPDFQIAWEQAAANPTPISRVVFSPESQWLAVVNLTKVVRLWRVGDGKLQQTIDCPDKILDARFAPDGTFLVAAGIDGRIGLFRFDQPEGRFHQAHDRPIYSLAFAPDGKRLASTGYDGTLRLWEPNTWPLTMVRNIEIPNRPRMYRVVFSPDGKQVATVGRDALLRILNSQTGEPEQPTLGGHENSIFSSVFSSDSRQAITLGADATLRWWDLTAREELFTMRLPIAPSEAMIPGFDFRCIASTGHCWIMVPLTYKTEISAARHNVAVYDLDQTYQ